MVSLPPVLRDKAWAPHSKPAIPSLSPGGHAVRAHTHTRPRKDSRGQNGARAGFARGGISDGAEGGTQVLESPLCPGDGGGSVPRLVANDLRRVTRGRWGQMAWIKPLASH